MEIWSAAPSGSGKSQAGSLRDGEGSVPVGKGKKRGNVS